MRARYNTEGRDRPKVKLRAIDVRGLRVATEQNPSTHSRHPLTSILRHTIRPTLLCLTRNFNGRRRGFALAD